MVGKDEGRYLVKNSREEATMKFVYSDGGRSKYFKGKNVGDCVTRAICNATGLDYKKVYDDLSAMQKKCKSKLPEDSTTAELWDYIHRAEQWLHTNTYTTEIRKWDTDHWGEIPADFGRK